MLKVVGIAVALATLMPAAHGRPLKGDGYYAREEMDEAERRARLGTSILRPEHIVVMSDGTKCLAYSSGDRRVWCPDHGFVPVDSPELPLR